MAYTLYNELVAIGAALRGRFHMPGHKGKGVGTLLDGAFALDFTEISSTGNLYGTADDIIKVAERRAAAYYGCPACLFLTCGATQGIKALIGTFCDGTLLVDRNTHKSIIDACALLDINPIYMQPNYLPEYGITAEFNTDELTDILSKNPEISAFILTSPTYYGYCHELAEISKICKSHKVKLIVDSAHGSHLKQCGLQDPISQGADGVVCSAHKTLHALTQGAFLLLGDDTYAKRARDFTSLFGTTSPSYPIMASLDMALDLMENADEQGILALLSHCQNLRNRLCAIGLSSPFLGDPLRLTVHTDKAAQIAQYLIDHHVEPEMWDSQNLVFIVTFADTAQDLELLYQLLSQADSTLPCSDTIAPISALPPLPRRGLSPKRALGAPRKSLPLCHAVGQIAGENLFLYPPGVPILTIGEIIDEISLEYLLHIRYNIGKDIEVISLEE